MIDNFDQFIHCEVYNGDGKLTYWLNVIYAHNQLHIRRILWQDINKCATGIHGPWIVIEDYNNVL